MSFGIFLYLYSHDITEILLKVALNTINPTLYFYLYQKNNNNKKKHLCSFSQEIQLFSNHTIQKTC